MARRRKLLERMRANPIDDWTIDNVLTIAAQHGLTHHTVGSHYTFGHSDVETICTVVARKPIKPIYIRKFVEFIDSVTEADTKTDSEG